MTRIRISYRRHLRFSPPFSARPWSSGNHSETLQGVTPDNGCPLDILYAGCLLWQRNWNCNSIAGLFNQIFSINLWFSLSTIVTKMHAFSAIVVAALSASMVLAVPVAPRGDAAVAYVQTPFVGLGGFGPQAHRQRPCSPFTFDFRGANRLNLSYNPAYGVRCALFVYFPRC